MPGGAGRGTSTPGKPVAERESCIETCLTQATGFSGRVPGECNEQASAITCWPATKATSVHGGRTQSRSCRDKRRGGQCYRYLTHHDAHSICYDMQPSLCEDQESLSIECAWCRDARLRNPSRKDRSSWEISSASPMIEPE